MRVRACGFLRTRPVPDITLSPIGYLATPFRDRFGIPRQPRLAPHARGQLRLLRPYDREEAVRGLEAFRMSGSVSSSTTAAGDGSPTVRPPRLGGNRRVGCIRQPQPFSPEPLGLSLVELLSIDTRAGVVLTFGGVDLLDGTPVLDIKPYLPFVESEPAARAVSSMVRRRNWRSISVAQAAMQLCQHALAGRTWRRCCREVLAQDPRPAYANDPLRRYGLRLYDLEVKWRCTGMRAVVEEIVPAVVD
jgi:tRNA-Thr(GGU) m(6)t(6)A37 methyltransferase TsaA